MNEGGPRCTLKLTPQHLAEVVNALQTSAELGRAAEKRRAARMEVQGSVVVSPLTKDGAVGQSFTAITRDISFVGVGLLLSKPLEEGHKLVVRLPRGTRPALLMLCVVMHCRPLADGLFVVGVEFISVTSVKDDSLAGHDSDASRVRQAIAH